ncbi:MAG: ABC transporter permease [Actinomycetota bacterium]
MSEFWDWEWVGTHLDLIGDKLVEHVWLTFLAVAIGLVISVPVAVYAQRHTRAYPPVTWVAGILYTIPSLALFALLIPFTGLSTLSAEIGLVSYTLLILIRNIVSGLNGVPDDVKETARGMGYTDRELLWRVEVPLALPVIVAGIRIATVTTIGLVTVTVFVGKGGLGYLILNGFRPLLPDVAVPVGLVLSFLLAVASDFLLLRGQRLLSPWVRPSRARIVT